MRTVRDNHFRAEPGGVNRHDPVATQLDGSLDQGDMVAMIIPAHAYKMIANVITPVHR